MTFLEIGLTECKKEIIFFVKFKSTKFCQKPTLNFESSLVCHFITVTSFLKKYVTRHDLTQFGSKLVNCIFLYRYILIYTYMNDKPARLCQKIFHINHNVSHGL